MSSSRDSTVSGAVSSSSTVPEADRNAAAARARSAGGRAASAVWRATGPPAATASGRVGARSGHQPERERGGERGDRGGSAASGCAGGGEERTASPPERPADDVLPAPRRGASLTDPDPRGGGRRPPSGSRSAGDGRGSRAPWPTTSSSSTWCTCRPSPTRCSTRLHPRRRSNATPHAPSGDTSSTGAPRSRARRVHGVAVGAHLTRPARARANGRAPRRPRRRGAPRRGARGRCRSRSAASGGGRRAAPSSTRSRMLPSARATVPGVDHLKGPSIEPPVRVDRAIDRSGHAWWTTFGVDAASPRGRTSSPHSVSTATAVHVRATTGAVGVRHWPSGRSAGRAPG